MTTKFRIGMGYDVHPFVAGRPLILGGIKFDYEFGLQGHSDADALLHAIADALLGALALGDLGDWFPDTEAEFKNVDSAILLQQCYQMVQERGFELENLDAIVVAEAPKIKPRRLEIRQNLAKLLNVSCDQISLKATTEEKMGYTGRLEGLKAYATVLLKGHT